MGRFIQKTRERIPTALFHFTDIDAAWSIVTGGSGKNICFWLKSCKNKNDDKELQLDVTLLNSVRGHLQENDIHSMLDKVGGFDKVFLNSFTQGQLSRHMLDFYGKVRLEFDFSKYPDRTDIDKCEYLNEELVEELASIYKSQYDSLAIIDKDSPDNLKWLKIENTIMTNMDIISKISLIKFDKEWEEEQEWRHVLHKQTDDPRIFIHTDGIERMKIFYSWRYLKSITIFYEGLKTGHDVLAYKRFQQFIKTNHWYGVKVTLRKAPECIKQI